MRRYKNRNTMKKKIECDGCGWHEGGPTLKTICATCNGKGYTWQQLPDRRPLTEQEREMLMGIQSRMHSIMEDIDASWRMAKSIHYTAFKSVMVRAHDRRAFRESYDEIKSILKKGWAK